MPLAELEFRASRSGGPGGQHVNTSSTRVEVWWDVAGSPALSEAQRQRLLARLASRLDGAGRLRLVSSSSRSQLRNREEVTERLRDARGRALAVPKPRKRTKPPRAAQGGTAGEQAPALGRQAGPAAAPATRTRQAVGPAHLGSCAWRRIMRYCLRAPRNETGVRRPTFVRSRLRY